MKKLTAFLSEMVCRIAVFKTNLARITFTVCLYLACQPAMAGFLSKAVCAPYRQMVDNELFVALAAISAAILVIVWKTGSSNGVLAKGIGILAAVMVAFQIENILYATFKVSVCS